MDLTNYFQGRGVELFEVQPRLYTPRRFGDPDAEHMATRRAVGLFDFSFMACLEIRGRDAVALLEAVQTRNVARLPVGRIRYTLLLRDDGTVLNDATVWRKNDDSWLLFVGRRDDVQPVFEHARAFDIVLQDRSAQTSVIALQGPGARETLSHVLEVPADLPYFAFVERDFRGSRCLVARIGYSGESGYELVIETTQAAALWEALEKAGATECGFTAVDTLRIEAGHILFTNELAGRVTPRELGLERLVERGRNTRAPARRLAGLLLDGPMIPSGIVTSACRSPLFERWIGLGFVSDACRYPGTRLEVAPNVRATVARLPFYDPMKTRVRV